MMLGISFGKDLGRVFLKKSNSVFDTKSKSATRFLNLCRLIFKM